MISPYIEEEKIQKRVRELGEKITKDYKKILKNDSLICVVVLKGSFVFAADLMRHMDLPLEVEFFGASSYGKKTVSSGDVKITLDLSRSIEGKHVLLIEDIVDTGLTLNYLLKSLRVRKPRSLKLCTLLLKPDCIEEKVDFEYLGFSVENRFLVGYGLDAGELHRNLPYLAVFPEGELEEKGEK